jgi:hypothetical protein
MEEITPPIEDTTVEAPITPIEEPTLVVETPIEDPVVPEEPTDTPPELPIDPVEVVTLSDEESLVGKAFSAVKDNITGLIVGVAFGASATFAINPDNTLQESITVEDVPTTPKEELVVRIETPKLDVQEYSIAQKDKNIARLQKKLDQLESAREAIFINQEPDWDRQIVRVEANIQGVRDAIAAENRDKDKAQPKLDALPDREINN